MVRYTSGASKAVYAGDFGGEMVALSPENIGYWNANVEVSEI
jgi:hypothetical protein